jgi:hypothetical protein
MKKAMTIIFFLCWFFNPSKPLLAQGIIITAYEPQSFLLKKENILAVHYDTWFGSGPGELLKMHFGIYQDYGIFGRFVRLTESGLTSSMQQEIIIPKKNIVDRKVFNALYNKPKSDEKELLRQAWKDVFGIDVWYPYYKAKKIERWVKKRLSIRIFKFKGEPEFQRDQVLYTLKTIF